MGIYESLGVRRVINARGSTSLLGGNHHKPEVLQAMADAGRYRVSIVELQNAVNKSLATLTKNEAVAVTNGCASAVAYATIACMCRDDKKMLYRLPDRSTAKRWQVIVQRSQYTPYAANVRQIGAEIVEVGDALGTSPDELDAAIDETTAAVLYSAGDPYEKAALPLPEVLTIAHTRGVPVIVDAAELLPPRSNLWAFTEKGADLVTFSGGKGLRGPQDSGLLLGNRELVEIAQSILSPRHGLPRSMKMSKEDMVGLLAAVETFLNEDFESQHRALMERAQRLCDSLGSAPGVNARIVPKGVYGQPLPRAVFSLDAGAKWDRNRLITHLQQGDPWIELGTIEGDAGAFTISPFHISQDEEEEVIRTLHALLD